MTEIRGFVPSDEASWLRCRVLGFLDTAYFDDVWTSRPRTAPDLGLVAVRDGEVVGICDASAYPGDPGDPGDPGTATIDTVVVHPDHRRGGIATDLLDALLATLADRGTTTLDAWTRDDPGTHAWYRRHGFDVAFTYLHVYASSPDEMADAVTATGGVAGGVAGALLPRGGFFHADVDGTGDAATEADLRVRFRRVHRCHRFVRSVEP